MAANDNALGYVGYSYFARNRDGGCAHWPSTIWTSVSAAARSSRRPRDVRRGVYRPLSRPLFIYVNAARLQRPEVKAYVSHYLRRAGELASEESEIALIGSAYDMARQRLEKMVTGTMHSTPNAAEMGIETLLTQ